MSLFNIRFRHIGRWALALLSILALQSPALAQTNPLPS